MEIKKIGLIATAAAIGTISCADLPKTSETRYWGEPSYVVDEFENLDNTTRKETEYKADSIIRKYNTKFAENCTPYSDGQRQNKNRRLDCVTFK